MRLASYNLENLFKRPNVMNQATWAAGRQTLEAYAAFNELIGEPTYTTATRRELVKLLRKLKLARADANKSVILRQNKGRLVKRGRDGLQIVARGRADWIGWLDLQSGDIDEVAIENTARIIQDVGADVLAVIEVEDRITLQRFNEQALHAAGGRPYDHAMLIDGNDARGIDVGLLAREPHTIASMRSHVDDLANGRPIFSRDCPEYELALPGGERLWLLVCHLKSKGYGSQQRSDARRQLQARRTREIYEALRWNGAKYVAVLGDFNDTPGSAPLRPLFDHNSELREVACHPNYRDDGYPGTFGNGNKSQKIDLILLCPELWARVTAAAVNRRGVWGGKHGDRWPILPEMENATQAASDHAAIWVDLNI